MVNFMGPGGGMAAPPYLQGRKPMITPAGGAPQIGAKAPQPMTQPMITPKQSVVPGETRPPAMMPTRMGMPQAQPNNVQNMAKQVLNPSGGGFWDKAKAMINKPKATPPNFTPVPQPSVTGATGGTSPISPAGQSAYNVLKGDLEDSRRSAMSGAVSDASSRGVYYGTPLTTSQGDIQTQYLRGLGQLQAGVLGNEQQNELSRLGIGANLLGQAGQAQGGKIDPQVMQMIGGLFNPQAQRPGPITPYGPNNNPNTPEIDPATGLPVQRKL